MADDHAADLVVIAWQQWRALRARLATQYSREPFDGDGPGPPGPPVEDTPALPFVVLTWQQWLVSRARLATQYAGGAFDDSVAAEVPPAEGDTTSWQPPRVRRIRWARNPSLFQSQPFDGDGPAPPAPVPDFPPPNFTVLAWQQWRAGRARLQTQFTDAPQDVDGFLPFGLPDQSLVVIPWFAGRVPMEALRVYLYSGGEQTDASGPDLIGDRGLHPSFIAGRTHYRPSRFNPQARLDTVYGGTAQDDDAPRPPAFFMPMDRPRRRR